MSDTVMQKRFATRNVKVALSSDCNQNGPITSIEANNCAANLANGRSPNSANNGSVRCIDVDFSTPCFDAASKRRLIERLQRKLRQFHRLYTVVRRDYPKLSIAFMTILCFIMLLLRMLISGAIDSNWSYNIPLYRVCRTPDDDPQEKRCLITTSYAEVLNAETAGYQMDGVLGLAAASRSPEADMTLYRFAHLQRGDHLFTTSEREKDSIIKTLPEWILESGVDEGVAFCSTAPEPQSRDCGLARILTKKGTHIYVSSDREIFDYRERGFTFEKILCFIKCHK